MRWVLLLVVFALVWVGSALLMDAWQERQKRPTLAERLAPFQPTISDEAESWFKWRAGTR